MIAALVSLASPAAVAKPGEHNSVATITGGLSDSCRDFVAHSSKDISHVVIRYADGRVVKDESIDGPDFARDGVAGDEIDSVDVKSGTTTEPFACPRTSDPPTAVLEILTSGCVEVTDGNWHCRDVSIPKTTWEHLDRGAGFSCMDPSSCDTTFHFRGIGSFDPDGDLVSWSLEFRDPVNDTLVGSAAGDWATLPPTDVAYTIPLNGGSQAVTATLTVTDSAGHSDSETLLVSLGLPD